VQARIGILFLFEDLRIPTEVSRKAAISPRAFKSSSDFLVDFLLRINQGTFFDLGF